MNAQAIIARFACPKCGSQAGTRCRTTAKACPVRRAVADRQLWHLNQVAPPGDLVTRLKRQRRDRASERR